MIPNEFPESMTTKTSIVLFFSVTTDINHLFACSFHIICSEYTHCTPSMSSIMSMSVSSDYDSEISECDARQFGDTQEVEKTV